MSLARALTRRHKLSSQSNETLPPMPIIRTGTVKKLDHPVDRSQISLPIELISTTNVLAYEAPDIHPSNPKSPLSSSSSAGSLRSYGDSDNGRSSASSLTTPEISREGSPTATEYNKHSYFNSVSVKPAAVPSVPATPQTTNFKENIAPSVPSRAMSHTKKTHQALAHKRSMRLSNKSDDTIPPPPPLSPSKAPKTPTEPARPQLEHEDHPFEAELAQVKEVAEEFGVTDVRIWNEEEQWLVENGYCKHGVEDYLNEIQPLFGKLIDDVPYSPTTWL